MIGPHSCTHNRVYLINYNYVNFKEVIELAVSKDNSIRPEYEKSLEEKQEAEKKAKEEADRIAWEEYIEFPWSTVQVAPIFTGCDNKTCSSKKIESFVKEKFNTNILIEEGRKGNSRIFAKFKFDKSGEVVDIETREMNPKIKEEIFRVINLLPNKIESPGFSNGREVFVSYLLNTTLNISEK